MFAPLFKKMEESIMNIRKKIIVVIGGVLMLSCTGCAGMTWDEMKEEGANLMQQGEEINQNLKSEAADMNSSVLSGNVDLQKGWKTVFEKNGLQIQYAQTDDIEAKTEIEDVNAFIEALDLEEWELTDDFPENTDCEIIYFIQEPVTKKGQTQEYKNIANMRCLPDEGYVLITIGEGLIDLSDTFELEQNSYTSVYKVPEEVILFLQDNDSSK